MKCLGIDIGSSSVKGAVLDLGSGCVGPVTKANFPDPVPDLPAGQFEIDPQDVVAVVRQIVVELLEQAPSASHLYCSSQMGGVLLVDSDGRPITNYLSWRDQRTMVDHSEGTCLERTRRQLGDTHFLEVGSELKPGSATSLLSWLAENDKLPAAVTPLGIGDFVVAALCESEPCTEPTQALGTLNLKTGDWHREAFQRLGLSSLDWPHLKTYDQPCGTLRVAGKELICHPVVGDQQAALAGIGLQADELSINISTGSQVSRLTRDLMAAHCQTRPYFDGWHLNTITHLPAGRSLVVLVDLLTELSRREGGILSDPWNQIGQAVETATDSSLDVDLAFFSGPMGEQGHIRGITTENLTFGSLFRAAFRNMADNYQTCAERLALPNRWSQVVLSGGLSQKVPLLRELILERLPGPHRECPEGDDTLLGLLQLARRALDA